MTLDRFLADCWEPPKIVTVSEWADEYRMLSPEASSEPGRWRTDRVPYLRSVMDCINEPGIVQMVLMFSAQSGKTEALLNALGKTIHLDPSPILFIQPTLEMAESFSKERVAPMIRDSPVLAKLVQDPRSRDSNNTLLHKNFPGGHLTMAGANSPASLASRPIKLLLCDEIDRYPVSAGAEGDPVSIAMKRTATFWNRFSILVSTPTIKGSSRIELAWFSSDQRLCFVPCPLCGGYQALAWEQVEYPGKGTEEPEFSGVSYRCVHCGGVFPESEKFSMLQRHEWRKTAKPGTIAGFHLNALYSPWQSWVSMARDYETARHDGMLLRVWWNTMLGQPWDDSEGTGFSADVLMAKAKTSEYQSGTVPEPVLLLAAGVDVQGDRLAVGIWGWSEESWLVEYAEILGDPLTDSPWQILESFLTKKYPHPTLGTIAVKLACVDTGYHTQDVYRQVRQRKNWFAIKGKSGDRPIVSRPSWQEVNTAGVVLKRGIRLYTIGVDTAKEMLYGRMRILAGDKAINLPRDLDQSWAVGFCSEVLVTKVVAGQFQRRWEKLPGVANEPLDTSIYALAAAILCGADRFNWQRERGKKNDRPDGDDRNGNWVKGS